MYIYLFMYLFRYSTSQCLKSILARDARKMLCDSGTSWRKRNPSSKTNIALKMNVARHSCFDGLVSWWFCALSEWNLQAWHWQSLIADQERERLDFHGLAGDVPLSLEGGGIFFLTVGCWRGTRILGFPHPQARFSECQIQMASMQECQV